MECVCADIDRDKGLYRADPATRTSLPFSSHELSGVGTTDSHGPRDINLKSLQVGYGEPAPGAFEEDWHGSLLVIGGQGPIWVSVKVWFHLTKRRGVHSTRSAPSGCLL